MMPERWNVDRAAPHLVERQRIREPLRVGDAPVDVEVLKRPGRSSLGVMTLRGRQLHFPLGWTCPARGGEHPFCLLNHLAPNKKIRIDPRSHMGC